MKTIGITALTSLYALLLLALSFMGADSLGALYRRTLIDGDNLLHVGAFVVLAFLLRRMAAAPFFRRRVPYPWAFSGLLAMGVAVLIEAVQYYLPTRHASVLDLVLHGIGVGAFLACDMALKYLQVSGLAGWSRRVPAVNRAGRK